MEELEGALSGVEVSAFAPSPVDEGKLPALAATAGPPAPVGDQAPAGKAAIGALWDRGPSGFRGSLPQSWSQIQTASPKISSIQRSMMPEVEQIWSSAAAPVVSGREVSERASGALQAPEAHVPGSKPGSSPSRSLVIYNVSQTISDDKLHQLMLQFGDVRSLFTRCKHRGFILVTFFDIRAAQFALESLDGEMLSDISLRVHYSIPMQGKHDKGLNNGTIVVFNLDSSISSATLRGVFASYGAVKEIRETPNKRHHRFVEFYDVRHSVAALHGLNRKEIGGKRVKIESSRPGGARCALTQQLHRVLEEEEMKPPIPESELVRCAATGEHTSGNLLVLPAPSSAGGGGGNCSCFGAGAAAEAQPGSVPPRGSAAPATGDLSLGAVGFAPSASRAGGAMTGHLAAGSKDAASTSRGGADPADHSTADKNVGASSPHTRDLGEFHLNPGRIRSGEDKRTTLMIKNIPNKYTEKMILQQIDECCKDGYDFFYLPIDFRNKCNVGYAFMNMRTPEDILPLYEHLNNKKWARFNSEKVCVLTYGRIQGFSALTSHFQRVSLRHEDKRRRPLIFK